VTAPAAARPEEAIPNGPLAQSVGIAFRLCMAATVLLALVWLVSNIRQVPPDATAVVTRFGRAVEVRAAGLLFALPRPIDNVVLLPGPDRQLRLAVSPFGTLTPAAGRYLTADGGVILLYAELTYHVVDPVAFMIADAHIGPALNRAFRAGAVEVAAATPLDDFLVVDQSRAAGHAAANARLRQALLAVINRRLRDVGTLGVEVTRLDLTAALPSIAKGAFDNVLSATQVADQALANARNDATLRLQKADRERDRVLNSARAAAAERINAARAHTATISALAGEFTPDTRGNVLDQLYRTRIGGIIARAGQVTAVDARGGPRVILPGGKP
jgi:membrane protease subunit HflK